MADSWSAFFIFLLFSIVTYLLLHCWFFRKTPSKKLLGKAAVYTLLSVVIVTVVSLLSALGTFHILGVGWFVTIFLLVNIAGIFVFSALMTRPIFYWWTRFDTIEERTLEELADASLERTQEPPWRKLQSPEYKESPPQESP